MTQKDIVAELLQSIGMDPHKPFGDDVARIGYMKTVLSASNSCPG